MERNINSLSEGSKVEQDFMFSSEVVDAFSVLTGDKAPVHFDDDFAKLQKFEGRIVHGLLLGSIFSGMLGQHLPGPKSVINMISLKYHAPVYIGETIHYEVSVKQISEAVGAVVLALTAANQRGIRVVSGQCTCSFPNPS